MRFLFAALVAAGAVLASGARAENRTFVIANNPDGYGVDRCLSTGASCGRAVATAYCRSRSYVQAASFRKLERDEVTGGVPSINGSRRDELIAIECMR
jgi:hypothetical protein